MFSIATFFDVVSSLPPGDKRPAPEPDIPVGTPPVVAFYGFRGGAGRTHALAYVAALLTERGHRVVVVDLDLEAPGLDVVLSVKNAGKGTAGLLHAALTKPANERLPVTEYLSTVEVQGRLLSVLAAGPIDETYLAQIEELGVALWHMRDESPLARVVRELTHEGHFDVVLLDCRTGFHGLSASAMFHEAHLAVTFLPLSNQVWEGLRVLLKATKAARLVRGGPSILMVPSMVPPGSTGRRMLESFIPKLKEEYLKYLGPGAIAEGSEEEEDADMITDPILIKEGLRYEPSIAEAGCLMRNLPALVREVYTPLADQIATVIGLRRASVVQSTKVDYLKILDEISIPRGHQFAEEATDKLVIEQFIPPFNYKAAIDRSTGLVVGAKGAGKTWLWRYLVAGTKDGSLPLPEEMKFAVGHGSDSTLGESLQLSAAALKEIDREADIAKSGNEKAFWILYCLARLAIVEPSVVELLIGSEKKNRQKVLRDFFAAQDALALKKPLVTLLAQADVGTFSEALLRVADEHLRNIGSWTTLVFDGLDTGFQIGHIDQWVERQRRFTESLLKLMMELRAQAGRLSLKVFLREDIFYSLTTQNISHMEAAKLEIAWRPEDVWRIALNIACTSPTYRSVVSQLRPGVDKPWDVDGETLQMLLEPLWGLTLDNKKAQTGSYILRRTQDALNRLFPRTIISVLQHSVENEKKHTTTENRDRLLRYASLKEGVAKASEERVRDLKREYVVLAPYLDALRGMDVTGSQMQFKNHMARGIKQTRGLHFGPGGWSKVFQFLRDVGVLSAHKTDETKLAVALMYRRGLGCKLRGLE